MRLNWWGGFNRLFLLAVAGWAFYSLWVVPGRLALKAWDEEQKMGEACTQSFVSGPDDIRLYSDCRRQAEREFQEKTHGSSVADALHDRWSALALLGGELFGEPFAKEAPHGHGMDPVGVLIVLGLIVIPPSVAYGLLWLGWHVGTWALRGFRPTAN